ncbi:MAG: hypothetical protein QIT35_gp53 [Methanophagales virus PBV299]|uniref:Uncharacterized protein n=1 Tax=Methanophagales virus PBV299 TaxID=2987730 RepID=A0ABY6GLG7_9CAUD|nr:MAG: hypothetical protein QIT35_gp53 [Methanophagales virus PBV299]UYL64849.1 MAG: hypothetical protein OFDIEDLO_00053 [Methanophagales virus PBV299]
MPERKVFRAFVFADLQSIEKSDFSPEVVVLEANTPIHDSTAYDRGFIIPPDVLAKAASRSCVTLFLGHDHKERLGLLCDFRYKPYEKKLIAKLHIPPEKRRRFLSLINRGINGISLELHTLEEHGKYLNRALKIDIKAAALVDRPACKRCRVKRRNGSR